MLGKKFSRWLLSDFFQEIGFDLLCKLLICMKGQNLRFRFYTFSKYGCVAYQIKWHAEQNKCSLIVCSMGVVLGQDGYGCRGESNDVFQNILR